MQIGSVASPGNALLNAQDLNLGSFASLGQVSISGGGITAGTTFAPTFDPLLGGGTVVIRSGKLILDSGAVLLTDTVDAAGAPVGIDLRATDSIVLGNGATIRTESLGAGDASGISIATGNLTVTDFSAIESLAIGAGRTGNIDINVGSADILNGTIRTSSNASGSDITINAANTVTISGPNGVISTGTFAIFPDPLTGELPFAGNIALSAGNVFLGDQAKIRSGGSGAEPGKNMRNHGDGLHHDLRPCRYRESSLLAKRWRHGVRRKKPVYGRGIYQHEARWARGTPAQFW